MGDRTSATVTIYDCPGKRRKIRDLLVDYGYSIDWGGEEIPPGKVVLGQQYTAHEMSLGIASEIVGQIRALFTDEGDCLVIEATEDPFYDSLGDYVLHTPIGTYSASYGGGECVFGESEIRKAVADGTLDDLLGTKHFDYLKRAGYTG